MEVAATPDFELTPRERRLAVTPAIEFAVLAGAVAIGIATYFIITSGVSETKPLSPLLVASLMVANLVPGVALLVLIGRRIAKGRAARSPIGGNGQLHVRLVALFSVLASVPTILVAIFASLLFQYGVEFWSSDRARGMLENATAIAATTFADMRDKVGSNAEAMTIDLTGILNETEIESPEFAEYFAFQTNARELSEAALVRYSPRVGLQTLAIVNPYETDFDSGLTIAAIGRLTAKQSVDVETRAGRIRAFTRFGGSDLYLYVGRVVDPRMLTQMQRSGAILNDYRGLVDRSRRLQLQFNLALLGGSLIIVGVAVFVALAVADRLVRPVGELVDAARRVAGGDFEARVTQPKSQDEVATLATAFNRMTERLQQQTNALVTANAQIESRRALIEAVMSGVSAGVVSIGSDRTVRLVNVSATALLKTGNDSPVGRHLREVAPELDAMLDTGQREAIVQLTTGGEAKTLAVKTTRDDAGQILTFDDITQQLLDQRRAAWSDVARRIAHEIKNPLTPIQLAAERLQRRYGKQIDPEDGTFARLTETIVRQVGDLRRMVDEFSSFARMPKPVFRPESLVDIARQALFLHEVAHPEIGFELVQDDAPAMLVCDRRQLGQALTNVIKNAVEAIGGRAGDAPPRGEIVMTLREDADGRATIELADNGVGLPVERDRIVEPYMTTRSRGTGLGLAIVKKIVEEHFGTIAFADRPAGGTCVTLSFDTRLLSNVVTEDAAFDGDGDDSLKMLTRNRT